MTRRADSNACGAGPVARAAKRVARHRLAVYIAGGAFVMLVPRAAVAQWTEIGKTVVGNPVYVALKSVSKDKAGIITATVRATFVKPVKTAHGDLKASKTVVMIDCVKRTIAVKENTYYFDEKMSRVYQRTAPTLPGFSSPTKGSLPDVAMGHLCT